MTVLRLIFIFLILGGLQACGGGAKPRGALPGEDDLSAAAQLGKAIFHDNSLSASGRMSCASCHDPARGHASPFDTPVAFGGANFPDDRSASASGLRMSPAIRYLRYNSAFRIEADGTPRGGFFWDGRANSLAEQAQKPFLAANEMANLDAADVVAKLARTPYADRFRQLFGEGILADPTRALERMGFALERYQIEDREFAPFSSKFDAVNAGLARFTDAESRGLEWFNRRDKGNCAACHPSTKPDHAPAALFTDFSYDSLGVPRNADIAANRDPLFFDLGLCGPKREDLNALADLCGRFKVPSLRNVALRARYFHNGRFDTLADVLRFYVTRDTQAQQWYPTAVYDDLPADLRGNVNVSEGPYNRQRGQAAALSEAEMRDLLAFLNTLTDGYTP